ncbi:TetR/AcrR family transcriptional regulator [Paenibacillus senegalensis]|uniref:TetR/AcrR family transcriptional regulator n=1 Tax=Paenibacillus senegalensis TaxID=1465766 RepID=UPI000289169E|nr:TetR/AcrR family transcriptional regulator [Paenibacillus senegalensis]
MSEKTFSPTLYKLLETAEELIKENGCKQTTIRDLVSRSGVSMGGIYHYVQSKEELFGLILEHKLTQIDRQFYEAVCQTELGDLEKPLKAIMEGFFKHLIGERKVAPAVLIYLVSLQNNPAVNGIVGRFHQKWKDICEEWIRIGQQAHAIPGELDVRAASAFLVTYLFGLMIEDRVSPDGVVFQNAYEMVYRLLQQPAR